MTVLEVFGAVSHDPSAVLFVDGELVVAAEEWKSQPPEAVHEDGTARAQVVTSESNPRYCALMEVLEGDTGNGVILNTSLNRHGEPIACSPTDGLNMFYG